MAITSPRRRAVATGFLGLMFVGAAISQAKLHVLERDETMELARETKRFTLSRTDVARRGTIYASDMKPLAQDSQSYELNVQFDKIPKSDAFYMDLSSATGIPASEFASLAQSGVKSKTWLEPINATQYEAIQDLRGRWRADGVSVVPAGRREYPLGDAAACLVGVIRDYQRVKPGTGKQGVPPKLEPYTVRTGVEGSKNEILAGLDGVKIGLTDRTGAFLPMRMEDGGRPRIDGKDVVLTIDSELQDQAAQAIRKAVEKHQADNGAAIVLDPKTGDILAMANWPSFDPNGHTTGQFGFNPAYMAQLEPGSTFKILTLAKALDEGKTNMSEVLHCSGHMNPTKTSRIRCDLHHGTRAHGAVDPVKAIAKSCNVCAATWALRIGRDEMIEFIEDLGLLEKTGIGVPGEVHGLFRRDEYAKTLQLATVGFGQSLTCTPIAITSAFSMLANDGVRMQPRLIKKIGDQELPIAPGKPIISKRSADLVVQCMEAVVESDAGTGKTLRIPGYRLGGKTGTAEKVGSKGRGYVSNFIGFIPAEEPRAVVMVMVNNPKVGGYYGATVAGPVFVEVAKSTIRRLNIPPSASSGSSNIGK